MAIKMSEIKKLTYDKDIRGMKSDELNETLSVAVKNANRKLGQWRKEGEYGGYVNNFIKDKKLNKNGNITTEGLSDQEKRKLLNDLVKFSKAKQSTVKGEAKIAKKTGERLGVDYDSWSEKDKKRFWQIYEIFKERNPDLFKYDEDDSKQKVIDIQRKIAKVNGIFTTKKGKSRKRWGKKEIENAVDALEEAVGIKKSSSIMSQKGSALKAKIIDDLDERKVKNVLKK